MKSHVQIVCPKCKCDDWKPAKRETWDRLKKEETINARSCLRWSAGLFGAFLFLFRDVNLNDHSILQWVGLGLGAYFVEAWYRVCSRKEYLTAEYRAGRSYMDRKCQQCGTIYNGKLAAAGKTANSLGESG